MDTAMIKIDSPRFGTLEVEPSKVIEFPRGLPGFEDFRRFTLFHPEGEEPKYFILQSLDDPDVAFNIADPAVLGFNFEIALSDEESALLDLGDPAEAVVVVLLVKEGSHLRANLKAPLVLNLRSRRGLQHLFASLNYEIIVKGS